MALATMSVLPPEDSQQPQQALPAEPLSTKGQGEEAAPPPPSARGLSVKALGERLGVSPQVVLKQWDALGPLFPNWCRAGGRGRSRRKLPDPDGLGWTRGLDGRFYPLAPRS